jgi:hypothetical protein
MHNGRNRRSHCRLIVQWHWKWSNSYVTSVNVLQPTNNVTSCTKCSLPHSIVQSVHFFSTHVICFKFVFIEMFDKLITYIVYTLIQLVVILVHTTGSTWYIHRCHVTVRSLSVSLHNQSTMTFYFRNVDSTVAGNIESMLLQIRMCLLCLHWCIFPHSGQWCISQSSSECAW